MLTETARQVYPLKPSIYDLVGIQAEFCWLNSSKTLVFSESRPSYEYKCQL